MSAPDTLNIILLMQQLSIVEQQLSDLYDGNVHWKEQLLPFVLEQSDYTKYIQEDIMDLPYPLIDRDEYYHKIDELNILLKKKFIELDHINIVGIDNNQVCRYDREHFINKKKQKWQEISYTHKELIIFLNKRKPVYRKKWFEEYNILMIKYMDLLFHRAALL